MAARACRDFPRWGLLDGGQVELVLVTRAAVSPSPAELDAALASLSSEEGFEGIRGSFEKVADWLVCAARLSARPEESIDRILETFQRNESFVDEEVDTGVGYNFSQALLKIRSAKSRLVLERVGPERFLETSVKETVVDSETWLELGRYALRSPREAELLVRWRDIPDSSWSESGNTLILQSILFDGKSDSVSWAIESVCGWSGSGMPAALASPGVLDGIPAQNARVLFSQVPRTPFNQVGRFGYTWPNTFPYLAVLASKLGDYDTRREYWSLAIADLQYSAENSHIQWHKQHHDDLLRHVRNALEFIGSRADPVLSEFPGLREQLASSGAVVR